MCACTPHILLSNVMFLYVLPSICGQCGRLDGVELHACGAVVLQQLSLLSCGLSHGCLLPSDLINTHWSSATKPEQIRYSASLQFSGLIASIQVVSLLCIARDCLRARFSFLFLILVFWNDLTRVYF